MEEANDSIGFDVSLIKSELNRELGDEDIYNIEDECETKKELDTDDEVKKDSTSESDSGYNVEIQLSVKQEPEHAKSFNLYDEINNAGSFEATIDFVKEENPRNDGDVAEYRANGASPRVSSEAMKINERKRKNVQETAPISIENQSFHGILAMEPRSRASPQQFLALVEFMERHGDLSRPAPGLQGRLMVDKMWLDLTAQLNSIPGGVKKAHDKWKKVWADWKTKTKKKNILIRRHTSGAGGEGPYYSRQGLTPLEERVVTVTSLSAAIRQAGILKRSFHASNKPSEVAKGEESEVPVVVEVPCVNLTHPTPSPPGSSTPSPAGPSPLPAAPTEPSPPRSPTPRPRPHSKARRNRGLTPYDRAASEFVAVERGRLELEERRDKLLHQREMERLRLDSLQIEASREHNRLLQQLAVIGQSLLETLQRKPTG